MNEQIHPTLIVQGVAGSKLRRVCNALLEHPDVSVVGQIVRAPASGAWTETVDILTGLKQKTLDRKALNDFMFSLIQSPRPDLYDGIKGGDTSLSVGRLYFDEPIGVKNTRGRTVTAAIDAEALGRAGMQIGEEAIDTEKVLSRRTWVRVYPNKDFAQKYLDYRKALIAGDIASNQDMESMSHTVIIK